MLLKYFKFTAAIFNFSLLFFSFAPISAEGSVDYNSVYLFYLYYDNDRLFADRDYEFKYEVVPEEFTPEILDSAKSSFKGEIVNFKNEVSVEFLFDPRQGNPDFLVGKIKVQAPYVQDGQKAVFYDSKGNQLLTIFVGESSFCNDDGICDLERGENEQTCFNDCKVAVSPLPAENTGGQNGVLTVAIYVLIIAGVALGGWFGWKKYKTNE